MVIYKITNKLDGKIYIGQTVQKLYKRFRDHVRGDKQPDGYLHRAIQRHGEENFIFEQIDSATTLEGLNVLEEFYIKKYNSMAPNGYNLLHGGLNKRMHDETKAKLRVLNKGKAIPNRHNTGNHTSPSDVTREKISNTLKGRKIENRWTGGNTTPRTDAQKAHLSELNKGKPNVALYKQVVCIETGVVYESVNAAALAHDVNRVTISGLIKSGKVGRVGFSFKFV